jgi:Diadenosine tetraphosphate (Ap4A) hydrolase and other HIT family hydrolases
MKKSNNLWAPWRIGYIQGQKTPGCIFCQKHKQKQDSRNYIIQRKEHVFSMLNLYPYNNGHVLIAPYRHIARLEKLTKNEQGQIWELLSETTERLQKTIKPQGFNIGVNVGKVAGAGIAGHLHFHVVPRWNADTNFMPILAGTKIISQSLDALYHLLRT